MEILPLAPLPPPRQLSEQESLRLEEQEEDVLRELRLFLRNVTERLSLDRRFRAFTEPVDIEEVRRSHVFTQLVFVENYFYRILKKNKKYVRFLGCKSVNLSASSRSRTTCWWSRGRWTSPRC